MEKNEERDNILYLTLQATGRTGKEWVKKIKKRQRKIDPDLEKFLLSKAFVPSKQRYQVAILRSRFYPEEYAETKMGYLPPNHEIGLLVYELLHTQDLKTWGITSIKCYAPEGTEIPNDYPYGLYPEVTIKRERYVYQVYAPIGQKFGNDEKNGYLYLVPPK